MDIIEQFLKKYILCDDQLKNYNEEIINEIVKIINGDFNKKNNFNGINDNFNGINDSDILLNYIGLYYIKLKILN